MSGKGKARRNQPCSSLARAAPVVPAEPRVFPAAMALSSPVERRVALWGDAEQPGAPRFREPLVHLGPAAHQADADLGMPGLFVQEQQHGQSGIVD